MALSSEEQRTSELDDVETLMRLYKAKVLRFVAFSLGDRDAAESITHDCLLKAHASRAQFRGDCSVSTWLMRIAFNLVRDHTKGLKFRFWKTVAASTVDVEDLSQYVPSRASSPEVQLLAREKVQMIQVALKKLTPRQRSVFVMRFVEEMDYREVADIIGKSVPAVRVIQHRALGNLRKIMMAQV